MHADRNPCQNEFWKSQKSISVSLCFSGNEAGNQVRLLFFFQKLRFNFQCLIPFSQEVLATRFLSPSETVVLCGAAICVGYGRHTGKTRDNGSVVNICQRGDRWNQPLQDLLLERYWGDRLCPAPAYAADMPVGAAAPACLTCGCAARWHNARHPRGCCDNSRSKCSKAL